MKAFILAAGLGTRLKPLTDNKPKALVEINGITLLEIVIRKLIRYGFNEIIINVHHFANQIIDFLQQKKNYEITIEISDEKNLLLDTGGGLKKTHWFFVEKEPFLIHNVDILTDIDLRLFYNTHHKNNSIATLAVQNRKSSRYLLFDKDKNLCGWRNDKTNEEIITREYTGTLFPFAFSGIHITDNRIFELMPNKEVFSIVDFYLEIAKENRVTYFDHTDSLFFDLGKKENIKKS